MWQNKDDSLYRKFEFKDFTEAFKFMTAVAEQAEAQNHHPKWLNDYNQVEIWLVSHDDGYKITDKDHQLAKAIDAIYEPAQPKIKRSERLERLATQVDQLYKLKSPNQDPLADWLYPNHVLVVADYAKKLAEQEAIDADLSQAAALLHDIADSVMQRGNAGHEAESRRIATELMEKAGYEPDDIDTVVDDALRNHSRGPGEVPQTDVGRVLASADAQAHLQTDFYPVIAAKKLKSEPADKVNAWANQKIDKDYNDKIFFEDLKQKVAPDYHRLKELFR